MKDKALRKALKPQPSFRLSPNFAYRTMRKVDHIALLRERRNERRTLCVAIILSVVLLAILVGYVLTFHSDLFTSLVSFCTGFTPHNYFYYLDALFSEFTSCFSPDSLLPLTIAGVFLLLLFLDRWMRERYLKNGQY